MQVATGTVVDGEIVLEGIQLAEGAVVAVVARGADESFSLTEAQKGELLAAVAEIERGERGSAEERLQAMPHGRSPPGHAGSGAALIDAADHLQCPMTGADLPLEDIETLLTSIEYSKDRVRSAPGTPYAVRQENLGRLDVAAESLRQVRRGSKRALKAHSETTQM